MLKNLQNKFFNIGVISLTALSHFIGGFDLWFKIIIIMMVGDFIFGFVNAWRVGNINSNALRKGGVKKIMVLFLIGLSNQLGIAFGIETLRELVISYYLLMEFVSILEHASDMEIPLPTYLKKLVQKLIERLEVKEVE